MILSSVCQSHGLPALIGTLFSGRYKRRIEPSVVYALCLSCYTFWTALFSLIFSSDILSLGHLLATHSLLSVLFGFLALFLEHFTNITTINDSDHVSRYKHLLVYLISLVGSRWNPHEISFGKCLCPVHGPDNECDRVRHPPSYHRSSSSGMFYLPIIEPWTSKGFSCGRLENLRNAHQYVPDTHLCATRSDASCIAHFEEV